MANIAVITGASRGIGLETAKHLVTNGWSVVLCSRNGIELREAVACWPEEEQRRTLTSAADVSEPEQMTALADAAKNRFGAVRALISNAGVLGPVGKLSQVELDDLITAMHVNFFGFINLYRAFVPLLKGTSSSRVIALAGGGLGGPDQIRTAPMYVPSKAALVSMVELLAEEVYGYGGTVNVVAPGNIPTTFLNGVFSVSENEAGKSLFRQAKERVGMSIGDSMTRYLKLLDYLLSEESSGLNGRFLSARWNQVSDLRGSRFEEYSTDIYRLRRIDNELFVEAGES